MMMHLSGIYKRMCIMSVVWKVRVFIRTSIYTWLHPGSEWNIMMNLEASEAWDGSRGWRASETLSSSLVLNERHVYLLVSFSAPLSKHVFQKCGKWSRSAGTVFSSVIYCDTHRLRNGLVIHDFITTQMPWSHPLIVSNVSLSASLLLPRPLKTQICMDPFHRYD